MAQVPSLLLLNKIPFDGDIFSITIAERTKAIPFPIERVYWLQAGDIASQRGNHAHLNSQQVLVALSGQIKVRITDLANKESIFEIEPDAKGLFIPENHWLSIDMPPKSLLLCISSCLFDNQVTLYDLEEFLNQK